MKDSTFLYWLAERLVHVYGESENVDFVRRTREIAKRLDGELPPIPTKRKWRAS